MTLVCTCPPETHGHQAKYRKRLLARQSRIPQINRLPQNPGLMPVFLVGFYPLVAQLHAEEQTRGRTGILERVNTRSILER